MEKCMAGRAAFFGGRWRDPCPEDGRHVIGFEGSPIVIRLCDLHFGQVHAEGLVTEPNVDPDEFYRRQGPR